VNHVTAVGAGDVGEQLTSTVSDAASITRYGLFDAVLSFPDVSVQATLDQHARDALRPDPQVTIRATPAAIAEETPEPWTAFDVGDTVNVRLAGDTPLLQRTGRMRVTSFTVEVDDTGAERFTGADLEAA
jgi:hypothetical protein